MQHGALLDLPFHCIPGGCDKEALVHVPDKGREPLHRQGKGEDVERYTGTRGGIEHAQHGARVGALLLQPG